MWVNNVAHLFIHVRLCRFCVVIRLFSFPQQRPIRPMTSDFEGFHPRLHLLHSNSWERVSISLFECWVLNKGTTGIMSVLWRGPWRWNEPGTSRTRSNNSNIRRREDTVLHVYLLSIFFEHHHAVIGYVQYNKSSLEYKFWMTHSVANIVIPYSVHVANIGTCE